MGAEENLNELYKRFLRHESKPEDIRRLMELFGTVDDQTLQELVRMQLDDPSAMVPFNAENRIRYDRIFNNLKQQTAPARPARKIWTAISAAASVILLLVTAGYYFLHSPSSRPVVAAQRIHNDVKPGGTNAYLILSDGQSIALAGERSGVIGMDAGKSIVKTANGQVEYVNGHNNHDNNKIGLNILQTPNGGHYRLVLADGTKVWLNAASQLTYPASFADLKERKIELKGEAYFEVAKDAAHPFIVRTDDQQIRVLGTHFNVNAYHDDGGSKTTLLEGSIRAAGNHSEAVVRPGQEVVSSSTGRLTIGQADTELAIAWKNDQFMFESEPVRPLMKKVARWYDVEVIYARDVPDVRFNGAISKFENISAVLKILESTGKIHFEVSGRNVYVTK
ncbi:FecR family protein [Mucilaginibacter pocheonensis]|uniref:FecR family protein n=1 Tax=Mucilaginibacter pocheonensis TaxID=398050 RepID=A0ABU1T887_9SPHI|nr:FecR domain-containing protein [Mucilaginibacter pocheonensis]MDR6941567.1 hypothetical protein [Mucilaginibacter pocheonensis]